MLVSSNFSEYKEDRQDTWTKPAARGKGISSITETKLEIYNIVLDMMFENADNTLRKI